jgi:cytochrome c biogenesis protein
MLLLVSSVGLVLGLMGSLFVQRRRIFVRVLPAGSGPAGSGPAGSGPAGSGPAGSGPAVAGLPGAGPPDSGSPTGGSSLVEVAGLPRTEHPGFAAEFSQLVAAIGEDRRTGEAIDPDERAGAREGAE